MTNKSHPSVDPVGHERASEDRSQALAFILIQAACFTLFLGRAWQHLFWDAPYRAIFWDESLLKDWVEAWTSMSWAEWVTSAEVDGAISVLIKGLGLFYALCAAASLRPRGRMERCFLALGSASLVVLSALYWKEKFYQLSQLLEYAIQFGAPLMLIGMVAIKKRATPVSASLLIWLRASVALTFVCHGLYAIGFHPVPGEFVEMTMSLLPVQDVGALAFLKIAGVLDVLIGLSMISGVGLQAALAYAAFWGLATAFARVAAFVTLSSLAADLHQWLPETVLRLCHGLVPLAAYVLISRPQVSLSRALDRLTLLRYRIRLAEKKGGT